MPPKRPYRRPTPEERQRMIEEKKRIAEAFQKRVEREIENPTMPPGSEWYWNLTPKQVEGLSLNQLNMHRARLITDHKVPHEALGVIASLSLEQYRTFMLGIVRKHSKSS